MSKYPIYMDNQATTPVDPRVVDAMRPYFSDDFGNAASRNHAFGWAAEAAVELARKQVAALIGASDKEIVFTSGATESNNLAIKGVVEFYKDKGDHIITLSTEHKCVLDTCKRLERMRQDRIDELKVQRLMELTGADVSPDQLSTLEIKYDLENDALLKRWVDKVRVGARVTYLSPKKDGLIDLEQLKAAITDRTILVSVMTANNEIGVVQPVNEIGAICRKVARRVAEDLIAHGEHFGKNPDFARNFEGLSPPFPIGELEQQHLAQFHLMWQEATH